MSIIVTFHATLRYFAPFYAPLRHFTLLYAPLRYFTVFRQTRSKERLNRFMETKSSGKPDLASPEDKGITAVPCEQDPVNSSCVKELENTSLACGSSSRDPTSSENPTSKPTSADLLNEQEILREFRLDTVDPDVTMTCAVNCLC